KGHWVIPTFPVMFMLASLSSVFYAYYRAGKKGLSQNIVLDLGIIGTVAGVLGARLFHILWLNPRKYWEHPEEIFYFWQGGFVSYGAVILIGLSFYFYLKLKKLPVWKYFDLMALGFPLVVFFVRVGCLGAGCCYGKPTDFFIHLTFNNPFSDAGQKYPGVPLHATQLYGMLNGLFLWFVLYLIDRRKRFDGQIVTSFVILSGLPRVLQEFLRGDVVRGLYFGGHVSTGQIMGGLAVVVGLILYATLSRRPKQGAMNVPIPDPAR